MKSIRLLHYAALGLLGGLGSWVLMQLVFHALDALSKAGFSESGILWIDTFIYEGALVGLGLGAVLRIRASLWYHHEWVSIGFQLLIGAFFGAVLGLFCFGLGQSLQVWQIPPSASRLTTWIFLGLFLGASVELFRVRGISRSGFLGPRVFSGGIGGMLGGGIFELLLLYHQTGPEHLFGLLAVGCCISLSIGFTENRSASFALRVLTGKQEGQIFLLDQNRFTLGYAPQNDLVLKGYAEVCSLHAHICKKNRQVLIENAGNGGDVLVNYRLADQQSMKKGDVVKIGTALLQYYET